MKSSPSRRLVLALCRPLRLRNTLPSRPVTCSAARHQAQRRAGKRAALQSGGDTRLHGALVAGEQVRADIGGKLDIASVQDTARFDSKSQGASVGFAPGTVSVSLDQQKVHSDYTSVQQQSGLRAGDGGFQVKVAGDASLTGAVIAATDVAVNNKNSFGANSLMTSTKPHASPQPKN